MDSLIEILWPILAAMGLGPLFFGFFVRMRHVETQLLSVSSPADSKSISIVAGCMIRGRICRAGLLSLTAIGLVLCFLTVWNVLRLSFGVVSLDLQPVGIVAAAFLLAVSFLLIAMELAMCLEPMEIASLRKLSADTRAS